MKGEYTTGNLKIELDGSSIKEIFEEIGKVKEAFDEEPCGCCKSKNITPVARKVDKYTFYEKRCLDCGARLAYGVLQADESLFPKRKNDEGYMPNKGWAKWEKPA